MLLVACIICIIMYCLHVFFFSSRRRHTRCALVTGVQTCALPIYAALLVGTNPRWEAALVNARLRKRFLQGNFGVGLVGQPVDLTYPYDYLGAGPETLSAVAEGNVAFAKILETAHRPMLILVMGALARPDAAAVLPAALATPAPSAQLPTAEGGDG